MTENKRFTIEYVQGNPTIFHIVDDGKHIDEIRICDLLNELNDENEQLKSEIKDLNDVLARYEEKELKE